MDNGQVSLGKFVMRHHEICKSTTMVDSHTHTHIYIYIYFHDAR